MGRVVVLSCALLALTSGCSLAGRTFGQYVDDKALTGSVKLRLASQRPNTVTRVNVDAFEGTVYLTGTVDSAEQKSEAEIAAWRVEGVEQVINDLQVRGAVAPSASPDTHGSLLLDQVPGIAHIDRRRPGAPALAYDAGGRVVATIYTVSASAVAQTGFDQLRATGQAIDHVSIFPVSVAPDRPEAQYQIVLWHVSPTEAAALK